MEKTPVNLMLGLCLVLLLFAACSKETIIIEEIEEVEEVEEPDEVVSEVTLEESFRQYLDAQNVLLQLFTTAMTETIRSAVLPSFISPPPAACVTYTDNSGGANQPIDISINFGNLGCDPGNSHIIKGEIIIQSTIPSGNLLDTRADVHPAFIRFANDEITINDYTFKLIKSPTTGDPGGLDLKFSNEGGNLPNFAFRLSDLTFFEITDNNTLDYVEIRPPYSPSPYMKVIPITSDLSMINYDNLYENTYDIKFEAVLPNSGNSADPLWQVKSYDYINPSMTTLTADFRIFTEPGDNLMIKPDYTWPLDGTMECWTKANQWSIYAPANSRLWCG